MVAEEPTIWRPHSCKKLGQTQAGPEDSNSHNPHSHCSARVKISPLILLQLPLAEVAWHLRRGHRTLA